MCYSVPEGKCNNMSVIRVNKNANYTVLSNYHFKEKKMSLKSKGLLSLMLSLPDNWNYSISGLVALSKDGKDSVMSALAELEEFGYLTRVRTTNEKGQFSGVEYNIYEEPQKDKPSAVQQNSGNQPEEKPPEDSPPQLSTKESNINKSNTYESNTNNNKDIYKRFDIILSEITDEELKELYWGYIDMRQSINSPITERGLQMLITRCERLSNFNIHVQKELLEKAIVSNWKSVFHPKDEEIKNANKEVLNELKNFYGDDY